MKKIITFILAGLMTLSAFSQGNDQGDRAEARRAYSKDRISPRLLEQLNLTTNQGEKIKAINETYRTKMQEMIKSDIDAEERKNRRAAYESERKNSIMAVLTAEQTQKLKKLQSESPESNMEYKEKIKTEDGKSKIKVKID